MGNILKFIAKFSHAALLGKFYVAKFRFSSVKFGAAEELSRRIFVVFEIYELKFTASLAKTQWFAGSKIWALPIKRKNYSIVRI